LIIAAQDRHVDGGVVAVLEFRTGAAEGGETGRPGGDEDALEVEALGDAAHVQGAASPVGEEGVVDGSVTLAQDARQYFVLE
jgi:hypothetical protein